MTYQYSDTVNNAKLDAIETTVGTTPKFQIYTGAEPANCAASATGTKLVDTALPSDWLGNAATHVKSKAGTWTLTGIAAGTAGYFRILDSSGATCHIQGSITATGGGGDLTLDNTVIASSQVVTINSFAITAANI